MHVPLSYFRTLGTKNNASSIGTNYSSYYLYQKPIYILYATRASTPATIVFDRYPCINRIYYFNIFHKSIYVSILNTNIVCYRKIIIICIVTDNSIGFNPRISLS